MYKPRYYYLIFLFFMSIGIIQCNLTDNSIHGSFSGQEPPYTAIPTSNYSLRLLKPEQLIVSELPVKYLLEFQDPIEISSLDISEIANLGTSTGTKYSLTSLGDERSFELTVIDIVDDGSITPDIDATKVISKSNLPLQKDFSDTVQFIGNSGLFKQLNVFDPVSIAGKLSIIGSYNNNTYYASRSELFMVETGSHLVSRISDGSQAVVGEIYYLYSNKVYWLKNDEPYGDNVWVFNLDSKEYYSLEVRNPSGPTMYRNLYCTGICSLTANYYFSYLIEDSNGLVYFASDDGVDSSLYKTDGTVLGTVKVKKIADTGALDAVMLQVIGDYIYFLQDSVTGNQYFELFVTDGTASGTKQLGTGIGIKTGLSGKYINRYENKLYFLDWESGDHYYLQFDNDPVLDTQFSANQVLFSDDQYDYFHNSSTKKIMRRKKDGSAVINISGVMEKVKTVFKANNKIYWIGALTTNTNDFRLWVSDQSVENMTVLTTETTLDIKTAINDTLVFGMTSVATGYELFSYNETNGLQLIYEFVPGAASGYLTLVPIATINNYFYFLNKELLFRTDGSTVEPLPDDSLPYWGKQNPQSISFDGGVLVEYSDTSHNNELFFYDGAVFNHIANTQDPGFASIDTAFTFGTGGRVGFTFSDRNNDSVTAFTDSSSEVSGGLGNTSKFVNVGATTLFAFNDASDSNRYKIMTTDFSVSGTLEFIPGLGVNQDASSFGFELVARGKDLVYFLSYDSTSLLQGFYRSDGTVVGTYRLTSIGSSDLIESSYARLYGDNNLLFKIYTGEFNLWYTDGTLANTYQVSPDAESHSSMTAFNILGSDIYYSSNRDIFKAGFSAQSAIKIISTANSTHTESDIGLLHILNGKLIYSSGWIDWKIFSSSSTGPYAGSYYFDYNPLDAQGNVVSSFAKYASAAVTIGNKFLIESTANEFWLSDGNGDDIKLGTTSNRSLRIFHNGKILLAGDNEIYDTDGTLPGTITHSAYGHFSGSIVCNTTNTKFQNPGSSYCHALRVDDSLSFASTILSNLTSYPLHKIQNGTWTTLQTFQTTPTILAYQDNHLVFRGKTAEYGEELWISDGTPTGTKLIFDFVKGLADGHPQAAFISGNTLYIIVKHGYKPGMIWSTDWEEVKNM